MSLFKCRDWWSTGSGHDEEFGPGGMALGNVDDDSNNVEKIITGSFSGMLRIYLPKERNYSVNDLLMETDLGLPVLQVEVGNFISTGGHALAVLHPRKLAVYTLQAKGNQQQTSFYQLQLAYEHRLDHTACNMVYGRFGGTHVDYLCVQSMDGQLIVFEQETIAFARYLQNFLLPGPLFYCKPIDSFITCNSSFELECYKYQVLASSSAEKSSGPGVDGLTQKKKVQVDWKVTLGETVLQILAASFTQEPASASGRFDILVLGERTLFCISESGALKSQKRLDFFPACMHAFPVHLDKEHSLNHLLIADITGSVMVYRDMQLVWASKCEVPPVCMRVTNVINLQGLLVGISEQGALSISYLGTEPPVNVVGGHEGKELNYEEMDEEHRRLLSIIRESTTDAKVEPNDIVQIRVQVPTKLEGSSGHSNTSNLEDEDAPRSSLRSLTVRVFVSFSGQLSLENVHLTVKVPTPVMCHQDSFLIPTLAGATQTPVIIPVTLTAGSTCIPSSTSFSIMAAYTSRNGEPRTATCEVQLPLVLFATVVGPVKNAGHKITLDTNRMPPQLTSIFEDIVMQSPSGTEHAAAGNVLTFQYYNGADVTIIVSKTAGRYRLQSSRFEALWLILHELVQRLKQYFASDESSTGDEPFVVSFQEALPLQDFFSIVDRHHAVRSQYVATNTQLGYRAHQFRAIQKRLLLRFKDKNPVPLSHLDSLLEGTFHQLNQEASAMESLQNALHEVQSQLAAAVQMIILLIQLRFGLDESSAKILHSYIAPSVCDTLDQGWEECTEAAVTTLLKTLLAKSAKESIATGQQSLQPLADTGKLKKHISVMCERLARGARLTVPAE